MINRTVAPESKSIDNIHIIAPEKGALDNHIPFYTMKGLEQPMLRIEFIIDNVWFDPNKPLNGMAVCALIKNGTKHRNAKQIVEFIDLYGAFLDAEYASDRITLTLYVLDKHFEHVLPIVKEILTESTFPEEEVAIYKKNQQARFKVNLQKNDFLVKKAFAHEVFGDSPYGIDVQMEHYEHLTREDLLAYYNASFVAYNMKIILSGFAQEKHFSIVNRLFGQGISEKEIKNEIQYSYQSDQGRKIYMEKEDALQSAIRIGKRTITRAHPDFPGFSMLCIVLGGYFGSRLMTNIREDKGFTYGISASLVPMKHVGQFYISTEVGVDVCSAALTEIYKEIDLLRSEEISAEELALVKNYMLGSLLGSLENIFSHTQKFKNVLFTDMDLSYYETYIQTIKNMDASTLLKLAQKYLDPTSLIEVVVGKK